MTGLLLPAVTVVLLATQATPPAPAPTGTAAQLAARVQERYDTVRDFEGEFVQAYQGGVLRTKTSERGTVAIKRPGRMRWVYTKPERKEFVSDGVRIYSYLPADKQVIVSPMPSDAHAATPALFLAGRANLVRDFTVSFTPLPASAQASTADLTGLKLVPKKTDPEIEWLILGIDPATLQIRHLVAADRQGGTSTFSFSNLKENRNLSDKLFEFRIPRGVDVITNGLPAKSK